MAILARIIQFILWLILATWLGRKLLGWLFGSPPGASSPLPRMARPLRRDPVCGTYVSEEISLKLQHEGEICHFCSVECRIRFEREHSRSARSERIGASA